MSDIEVLQAIRARRTIRAFKPDPVPKATLEEILDIACWAPSWANTQPWEVTVIGGEVMRELEQRFLEQAQAGVEFHPDIPIPTFPEELQERRRRLGFAMYAAMGIPREDRDRRRQFSLWGSQLFGAPNGILLYMDSTLNAWSVLDIGLFMENVMLAALHYGLGASPLYAFVRYPDVLREVLGIPKTKTIVCGIAIGYPDWEAPVNTFERTREPLERIATWYGFD